MPNLSGLGSVCGENIVLCGASYKKAWNLWTESVRAWKTSEWRAHKVNVHHKWVHSTPKRASDILGVKWGYNKTTKKPSGWLVGDRRTLLCYLLLMTAHRPCTPWPLGSALTSHLMTALHQFKVKSRCYTNTKFCLVAHRRVFVENMQAV